MAGVAQELIELIEALRQARYPVLVIMQTDGSKVSGDIAQYVANACGLCLIDYRRDILSSNSSIVLGAYLRAKFRDWLVSTARDCGGVFVLNADELISSWSPSERKAFFRELLYTECYSANNAKERTPIVLLSRHAEAYVSPAKGSGQGIVFRPSTK